VPAAVGVSVVVVEVPIVLRNENDEQVVPRKMSHVVPGRLPTGGVIVRFTEPPRVKDARVVDEIVGADIVAVLKLLLFDVTWSLNEAPEVTPNASTIAAPSIGRSLQTTACISSSGPAGIAGRDKGG
jgi:hypothetical protein